MGPQPWRPNQGEWAGPKEFKQNLRVTVEGQQVTITYLDHFTKSVIREVSYDVTDPASYSVRTDVAWPQVPDARGDIPVTAEIPAGEEISDGALTLSVDDGGLALDGARNAGDRLRLRGVLPNVSVTDTRADGAWSVTGSSSDLTAEAATVRAESLGWEPFLVDGKAQPGLLVLPKLAGGAGLAAPAQLGAGVAGSGTSVLSADVSLEVPVDTKAGSYAGAMMVSLFAQD